jgi:predicted homoserine dehydrogenase-like protein
LNLHTLLKKRAALGKPVRVGLIGAGKFGSMFLAQARVTEGIQIVGIADLKMARTRDALGQTGWAEERLIGATTSGQINDAATSGRIALTEDPEALIGAELDVVVECTGNPDAGVRHALWAIDAGRHVVMVTVEADALIGPLLAWRAEQAGVVYGMAYGDQPALICELVDWARTCGFEVVAAGKGTKHLPEYHYSTPDTVFEHYGFTTEQVQSGDFNAKMFNSFLDGTKSAIEMAAVANATELTPQSHGLSFPPVGVDGLAEVLKPETDGGLLSHSGTVEVVSCLDRDGSPVPGDLRWGVYITFRAPSVYAKRCFGEYGMLTDQSGQYAALFRPNHLIGLELGISVASAAMRGEPTGVARQFLGDVVTCAKRDLAAGERLDGEGGYTVFGKLMPSRDSLARRALPMGLASVAVVTKRVAKDQKLSYDDVELPQDSLLVKLRRQLEQEGRAG